MQVLHHPFNIQKYTYLKMNWPELIGGGAMGALIRETSMLIRAIRRTRKKTPAVGLLNVTLVFEAMKIALDRTVANRVTISKVEDSGGPLIPGSDVFVSVMYEDYQRPLQPISENFQRWRADKSYIEILAAACDQGSAKVEVEKLPDGALKSFYRTDGLKHTQVYVISQTQTKLFVLTVSTKNSDGFVTDEDKSFIEVSVNRIRNLFKTYQK